jgi:hypothetical protein
LSRAPTFPKSGPYHEKLFFAKQGSGLLSSCSCPSSLSEALRCREINAAVVDRKALLYIIAFLEGGVNGFSRKYDGRVEADVIDKMSEVGGNNTGKAYNDRAMPSNK